LPHGVSIHRELELLVQAGLSSKAALAAATSVPADHFGLEDRGRIAPGLRADLLLVEGDPTEDITATRKIVGVWKEGVKINREAYRSRVTRQKAEDERLRNAPPPKGFESGLVSDFESGKVEAAFGFGWQISTDSFIGGKSKATMKIIEDGADGSSRSLLITGEIAEGSTFPWAGAIFTSLRRKLSSSGPRETERTAWS